MQNNTKSLILKECSVLFYCSWRFGENPISEFCCSTAQPSKCIFYQHLAVDWHTNSLYFGTSKNNRTI